LSFYELVSHFGCRYPPLARETKKATPTHRVSFNASMAALIVALPSPSRPYLICSAKESNISRLQTPNFCGLSTNLEASLTAALKSTAANRS
jgi:hypothetical protein